MSKAEIVKDFGFMGECVIIINYDYQPEEEQTKHYPGCPEDVTITYARAIVMKERTDLMVIHLMPLLSAAPDLMRELEQDVLESIHEG